MVIGTSFYRFSGDVALGAKRPKIRQTVVVKVREFILLKI